MANPIPPPIREILIQRSGMASNIWVRWWTALSVMITNSPRLMVSPVRLTGQSASIPSTSIVDKLVAAGLYRLTWYTRITVPGTVSSSLQVTLGWTDHGVAQTFSAVALAGNTITSWQSQNALVYIDAGLPVTYSTTYASAGATAMQYQAYVTLVSVSI